MSFCPYCGSKLGSEPRPGELPGTVVCPTCGQELDAPGAAGEPSGGAAIPPQTPSLEPPPETPPGQGAAAAPEGPPPGAGAGESPPPPPPPPSSPGRESAGPAGGPPPAWESGEGGVLLRLWRTTWQVLLHPVRTLSAPAAPGYGYPLGYGMVLATLGGVSQAFYRALEGGRTGLPESPLGMLAIPLGIILVLFFSTVLVHAMLFLLRGSRGGLAATFRAVAYSQASQIWFLIPVLGVLVGSVWQVVALVGGLSAVHGIGRVRAFLALVLPVLLLVVLAAVIVAAFGLGALTGGGLAGLGRGF